MPTVQCSCGQELHYSADKVGLIARCRCGRPVRLPEAKPAPRRKSHDDLLDDQQRAASKRRQFIAVLAVAIVTIVAVLIFARLNTVRGTRPSAVASPGVP
ncbi:MAG: hypothetical protein JWL61_5539 [Gemmatimonadetes bacterium]|nr:hypothetical protein [Gemmatimonadota bacterium]